MEKVMYHVFFKSTGLVKSMKVKLEGQDTWTKSLSEILQEVVVKGPVFNRNNAYSYTAI